MTPALALRRFLATEAAGGIVLLGATVVTLVWANSPWQSSYGTLWAAGDLRHWVNDGLMTVFFLVVGLEIKRELVAGDLRDRRVAALPVIGALGGMVVPALVFLAVTGGGAGSVGWGVPMATDIAFAVGVVVLLGPRVPPGFKLFLLTLAIVDDIGAILVIAVVYSRTIHVAALAVALAAFLAAALLHRARVTNLALHAAVAVVAWVAMYHSGVHATIAGVVIGLLAPAASTERLERALHPLTSFLIVPVFALANAGITIRSGMLDPPGATRVALAVVLGLVVGKTAGITGAAWLAVRSGAGALPPGATWRQLVGVAALAGIGFTVALFVAGLAFDDAGLGDATKLGVLAASVLAGVAGTALLVLRPPGAARDPAGRPSDPRRSR